MDAKIPDAERRGRDAIIVDEWGPYDWKSPKLWPERRADALPLTLRVLGPEGTWKVASVKGATVAPAAGRVPGTIVVTPLRQGSAGQAPAKARAVDFDVRLEYRGAAVVGPRGEQVAAGEPFTFGYARYFVPADWQVRYFTYDEASRPDKAPEAFARIVAGAPIKSDRRDRLDYMTTRTPIGSSWRLSKA